MILALNTAEAIHEMALLKETENGLSLVAEKRWPEDRQDVETLVPRLEELLEESAAKKDELSGLVVVKGPGSFTSLRTGVAFANALVEGLSAGRSERLHLYELSTFELLERKAACDALLVILQAGGLDAGVYSKGELKVGPLSELLAKHPHNPNLHVASILTETLRDELHSIAHEKEWKLLESHELQSFGEALQTIGLNGLRSVDCVEPFYLKGPKITVSSDPWKQVR